MSQIKPFIFQPRQSRAANFFTLPSNKPVVRKSPTKVEPKLVYPLMNKEGMVADLNEISSKYDQKSVNLLPMNKEECDPNIVLKPLPLLNSKDFQSTFDLYIKAINQLPNTNDQEINTKIIDLKKAALLKISESLNLISISSNQNVCLLFSVVEKLIFPYDHLPNLPKHITLDYAAPISNPNWPTLSTAYRIYITLLNNNSKIPNIDFNYFQKLIKLTGTPDFNERIQLSHIMRIYAENHINEKEKILNEVENALIAVLEGVESPYCVTPLCSFFSYFCTMMFITPEDTYHCFVNAVLPVTTAYFYPTIHQFFNSWISCFCKNSEQARKAMFDYLVKHWPVSAQKQWCFFELLDALMNISPQEEADKLAPLMIQKIEDGLTGTCTVWCNSALSLLLRSPAPKWLLKHLNPNISKITLALRKVSISHYNEKIVEQANMVYTLFYRMNRASVVTASKAKTDEQKEFLIKEKQTWESWMNIVKAAERKDSTIKMFKKRDEVILQYKRSVKNSKVQSVVSVKSDTVIKGYSRKF